ncbi:uncharacterized protein V1510DRAFT_184793 [Dipodascopsis tothii]|uniref:uncharacterized protein n=1 Tax=Dipodascopsis tothii TaxID=44089 RepID=UPI0034CDFAF9
MTLNNLLQGPPVGGTNGVVKTDKVPRIAIIGGGMAGTQCARHLLKTAKSRVDITIYEARDRLGGRIDATDRFGKPVDMGPNWLHGDSEENPIRALFEYPGVRAHNFADDGLVIDPDGVRLPDEDADELESLMWGYVEQAIYYSEQFANQLSWTWSLYDFVSIMARGRFPDDTRKVERILMYLEVFGFYIGEDVRRQSLRFSMLERPMPGETLFVASGYNSVFDIVRREVVGMVDIRYNTPVRSIRTQQERSIITADGCPKEIFDAAVVAVPLGVLKNQAITFQPLLPHRIECAIRSLGYGRLEKVYIKFPKAFWKYQYVEFLSPSYASRTNPKRWPMTVTSLAHLPEPYSQPVLLWYLFGELSVTVLSLASDEERIEFFRPYFERIPGYKAKYFPTDIVVSNWLNDEWAGNGSYTNFPIGLIDGFDDLQVLRDGVEHRKLWLAGEHCGSDLGLATVAGAYQSGTNAAEKVLDSLQLKP